jgi:isocitrate lyase
MFELAHDYSRSGMSAYVRLQEKEFALADAHGYSAVRHQRFVGTGYFDAVQTTIAGGRSSTEALAGSTENAQFVTGAPEVPCFRPMEKNELLPGVSQ